MFRLLLLFVVLIGEVSASCTPEIIQALKTRLNITNSEKVITTIMEEMCGTVDVYGYVNGHLDACHLKDKQHFKSNLHLYSKEHLGIEKLREVCRTKGLNIVNEGNDNFMVTWTPNHSKDFIEDQITKISKECDQTVVGKTVNMNGRFIMCTRKSKYHDLVFFVETLLDSKTVTLKGKKKPEPIHVESGFLECPSGGCGNNRRDYCIKAADGYEFDLQTIEFDTVMAGHGSQAEIINESVNRICWYVNNFTGVTKARVAVMQNPK